MLYPPIFLRPRYTDTCRKERERESGGVSLAFAMWDLQSSQSYGVVFVLYCAWRFPLVLGGRDYSWIFKRALFFALLEIWYTFLSNRQISEETEQMACFAKFIEFRSFQPFVPTITGNSLRDMFFASTDDNPDGDWNWVFFCWTSCQPDVEWSLGFHILHQ